MRVVLADDVPLREGPAGLLERAGLSVVGRAGDGPGLLAAIREANPDVVVTDIRMPPAFGTEGSTRPGRSAGAAGHRGPGADRGTTPSWVVAMA